MVGTDSNLFQFKFVTRYSADAFIEWIEEKGYSPNMTVIANSSKIPLQADAEPFVPCEDYSDGNNNIDISYTYCDN